MFRNCTTHNDTVLQQQEAPRPQGSGFTTAVLDTFIPLPDNDEKPAINFNDDFDGGFILKDGHFFSTVISAKGMKFLPDGGGITMLVDSGAR